MNIRFFTPSEKFYEVSTQIVKWNTFMKSFQESNKIDYMEIRKNAAKLAASFENNQCGEFIGQDDLILEEIKSPCKTSLKLIYIHGGGFVAGSLDNHRPFVKKMATFLKADVIMFDYPLAPENPFPAAVEKAIEAILHVIDQYPDSSIGLIGDSAGANICLSTLMMMRDQNLKLPDSGIFLSGFFDLTLTSDSIIRNKEFDIVLTKELLEESTLLYSNGKNLDDQYLSPLYGNFKTLPPLFFQVGASEILLDDSIITHLKALKAGVNSHISIWPEMMHSFQSYSSLPEADIALQEIRSFIDMLET